MAKKLPQLPSSKSDTPLTDAEEKREVSYIVKQKGLDYAVVLKAYREAREVHPFPNRADRIRFTEKLLNYETIRERKALALARLSPPMTPYKVRIKPDSDGSLNITVFPEDNQELRQHNEEELRRYDNEEIRQHLEPLRNEGIATFLGMSRNEQERAVKLEQLMRTIHPEQIQELVKELKTREGYEELVKLIVGYGRKLK
jgi:hypothetical protein